MVWARAGRDHGACHSDMHAGKSWGLDDGRGCYLDVGIMGELTGDWQQRVKYLFYTCMFDLDFTRVAAAYRKVGVFPEGVGTDEEIGAQLRAILGPLLTGAMASLNLGHLITQSMDLLRAYAAKSPQELVLPA